MHLSNIANLALLVGLAVGHPLQPQTGVGHPLQPRTRGSTPQTGASSSGNENTAKGKGKQKEDDSEEGNDDEGKEWTKSRWQKVVIQDSWYETPAGCNKAYNNKNIKPDLGCTGVWWDEKEEQVNAMYGNAAYLHASHVAYHYHWSETVHKKNHDIAWALDAKDHKDDVTRPESLAGLRKVKVPLTFTAVRDEKMPAALRHDKLVTVAMLPSFESQVESSIMSTAINVCIKHYGTREKADGNCKIKLWDWRSIDQGKYNYIEKLLVKYGNTDPEADNPATVDKGDKTPPGLGRQSSSSSESLDHSKPTGGKKKPSKPKGDGPNKKPKTGGSKKSKTAGQ